jgi:hypothetical protein
MRTPPCQFVEDQQAKASIAGQNWNWELEAEERTSLLCAGGHGEIDQWPIGIQDATTDLMAEFDMQICSGSPKFLFKHSASSPCQGLSNTFALGLTHDLRWIRYHTAKSSVCYPGLFHPVPACEQSNPLRGESRHHILPRHIIW